MDIEFIQNIVTMETLVMIQNVIQCAQERYLVGIAQEEMLITHQSVLLNVVIQSRQELNLVTMEI